MRNEKILKMKSEHVSLYLSTLLDKAVRGHIITRNATFHRSIESIELNRIIEP